MALVTKMIRCAVCGSSDVSFDGKTYHCATCGTDSDVSMPAADIAAVNRIVAMRSCPVCAGSTAIWISPAGTRRTGCRPNKLHFFLLFFSMWVIPQKKNTVSAARCSFFMQMMVPAAR